MISTLASRLLRNISKVAKTPSRFESTNRNIGVLGVPLATGQPYTGVRYAPNVLRQSGLINDLHNLGFNIQDHGDLDFTQFEKYECRSTATLLAAEKIAGTIEEITSDGSLSLTLGGDHSVGLGSVLGHLSSNPDAVVFWVDAHADLNTPITSPTGNVHGMVLAYLVHEISKYVPHQNLVESLKPVLSAKDLCYIGIRDLDPAERYFIDKYDIACYTMQDIDRHGIAYIMEDALERVNPGLKRPIHLSMDIDSLDPLFAPSTGTPVVGGLSIREGCFIAEEIDRTGMLSAVDLVEINPTLGDEADRMMTLKAASSILRSCFTNKTPHRFQEPRHVFPNMSI